MVRRSLIAVALVAVAAPVAAQSSIQEPVEWTWSADRPDSEAPLGVFGARTMEAGEFRIGYRFYQTNWQGVWFGRDSLDLATTLQLYDDAPLTRSDIRHQASVTYGVSSALTLMARAEFAVMERETISNGALLRTTAEEIGDVEVGALYSVYNQGAYRMHVQAGAVIPTGASSTFADTTRAQSTPAGVALPYDMRPGGGVFGALLGITGSAQNDVGTIGGQFRMRTNFGSNSAGTNGFTPGDEYEANGWVSYNVSPAVSVGTGVRWQMWGSIAGADDRLKTSGDPHNQGGLLSGQRAMMPVGVNFLFPEDSNFAGHRLSLEGVYSLHTDYEGPQMGLDWGLNVGWSMGVGR